jgi:glyoxylase-like metal-dependent hydrolase (beta-lactamase superfamily II)
MKIIRILKGAGIRSNYGTMGAASVTLVRDDRNVLIDTGHFGNRDNLLAGLKENRVKISEIDAVVLTHLNWDHCLNVDLFKDSEIIIGKDEYQRGTLSGLNDDLTEKFKDYLERLNLNLVEDGYKVSENTNILSTPGHTAGHVSLIVNYESKLTVIAGDAVPNIRAYKRGIPDLIFYDLKLAKQSIARIKALEPNEIIPGHDPPFNLNGYLEKDPIDILLRNEDETNSVLTIQKTSAEKPVIFNE